MTEMTESTDIDQEEDDNRYHQLFQILKQTQCPLMPTKVNGKLEVMYYFNNEFWTERDSSSNGASAQQVIFESQTLKNKLKNDAELMLCIDQYTDSIKINKSYEIHHKLKAALAEAKYGFDDGDDSNDVNKILIPTWISRILFLSAFIMSAFNGYYVYISFMHGLNGEYETYLMNIFADIVSVWEIIFVCTNNFW